MHRSSRSFLLFVVMVLVASLARGTDADRRPLLSPTFGDHMVLQRNKPNSFWGWTDPGREVRVHIGERTATGVAGADGRWETSIEVPPPGGPYTVTIDGGDRIELHDVLVGDVWLCGGQSNMEWPLRSVDDAEHELAAANLPNLRLCQVTHAVTYTPAATVATTWKVCTPTSVAGFSAVGYLFGRRLQTELGVPIGLISASQGGSPAESWMAAGTLARLGEFTPHLAEIERMRSKGGTVYGSFLMSWLDEHDVGGKNAEWGKPEFDDHEWKSVPVPGGFAELGVPTEPAVVWFRRTVTLPDPLPAGKAVITLGVVERMDTVYVNGRWVGASSWVENPRKYTLPSGVLQPGRNVIAVRVFKSKPDGGFLSSPETLGLDCGDTHVALAGEWRGKVSFDARPPTPLPLDFDNYPTMPTVLYNGMIAPLAPLAVTGVIWYQGEANTTRVEQYRKLMPGVINDWRTAFRQGDIPFYLVSLPAFMARKDQPTTDGWAELREVQAFTVRNVRNTGLAVTIDTGDADNIHPTKKQPVGERLALCALAGHYRRNVVASGPTLRFVERRTNRLLLHFDHTDGGLKVHGEKLAEFAIAGSDHAWHWADATIEGEDVVVVSHPDVPAPVVVRYAWQGNPRATLFNGAGLPAAPFRTDE